MHILAYKHLKFHYYNRLEDPCPLVVLLFHGLVRKFALCFITRFSSDIIELLHSMHLIVLDNLSIMVLSKNSPESFVVNLKTGS